MTKEQLPSPEMQALCSLTPGGSEFVYDIEACVKYIRDRQLSLHKAIVTLIKERNTLRNSHNKLIEALGKAKLAIARYNARKVPLSEAWEIIEKALYEAKGVNK